MGVYCIVANVRISSQVPPTHQYYGKSGVKFMFAPPYNKRPCVGMLDVHGTQLAGNDE